MSSNPDKLDQGRNLVDQALAALNQGVLRSAIDLADRADVAIGGDTSPSAVEVRVSAASAKAWALRNQDRNREAWQVAGGVRSLARVTLPWTGARIEAESLALMALEATLEVRNSTAGLEGVFGDWVRLAEQLATCRETASAAANAWTSAASIGRRLRDKHRALFAAERALEPLMRTPSKSATVRYCFTRALIELEWGSAEEADEHLHLAGLMSNEYPGWRLLYPFGVASQELRFGDRDDGTGLLYHASVEAANAGFYRAARLGNKDLAPLLGV